MVNLLNGGMTFFGIPIGGDSHTAKIWLIVFQVLIVVVVISAILFLLLSKKFKKKSSAQKVTQKTKVVRKIEVVQPKNQIVQQVSVPQAEAVVERQLTGISLDLSLVKRDFITGEQFNSNGLVVRAEYNIAPTAETYVDYDVIDYDTYARLERRGKATGLYVIKPYMYIAGTRVVTVKFKNYSVEYPISITTDTQKIDDTLQAVDVPPVAVEELVVPTTAQEENTAYTPSVAPVDDATPYINVEPAPEQQTMFVAQRDVQIVEEDAYEATLRYDRSFMARFIQSEDEIKHWYTDIKNDLLSYKGVKARMSWKRETFKCGGKLVLAKLAYRGKVLCVFLPLKLEDYSKIYPVEDASDASCYEDTPLMIRLKNPKRIEIARTLIRQVMAENGMQIDTHESVDYYLPYEGVLNLINKGLIKRNIRTPEHEAIFNGGSNTEDEDDPLTLTKVGPGIYVTKK